MIAIRPAAERGRTEIDWLDSRHTFSFGEYFDPRHMGFRALRVINEDRVVPGAGFPTHGHRNMEIVTYVLDGAIAHKDSLGTGSVIRPGEVQRMTAGTGIRHSEFNHSEDEPLHFLQIWILPEKDGLPPGYEQKSFAKQPGALRLVGSRDGRDGSITVHQDVDIHAAVLRTGDAVDFAPAPDRHMWVQVARGAVTLNGQALRQGDGAAVSKEPSLKIVAQEDAEIVLFDLA
ncbi:MAG TPA: pirin family protein [Alphaproteobacteria bacterium]|nr:pirin family protein [Alphaproteobacteria bacterium]